MADAARSVPTLPSQISVSLHRSLRYVIEIVLEGLDNGALPYLIQQSGGHAGHVAHGTFGIHYPTLPCGGAPMVVKMILSDSHEARKRP